MAKIDSVFREISKTRSMKKDVKEGFKIPTVADANILIMDTAEKLGINVVDPDDQADKQLNILKMSMWDAVHLGFQAGVASQSEDVD